jgi:hypothetical protein
MDLMSMVDERWNGMELNGMGWDGMDGVEMRWNLVK